MDVLRELCTDLQSAGLRGRVKIWGVKDEERYANMSRNDWEFHMKYKDYGDIHTIFIYDDKLEYLEENITWD